MTTRSWLQQKSPLTMATAALSLVALAKMMRRNGSVEEIYFQTVCLLSTLRFILRRLFWMGRFSLCNLGKRRDLLG
jgi:hypothetical protein